MSDLSPAEGFNLSLVFDALADAVADRECVVMGDRRLTYHQIATRARRLGSYLAAQGLGCWADRSTLPGHGSGQDHVALLLHSSPEYLEAMLGSFRARLAPFNVNYRYVGDELLYLFHDAAPKVIIYHAALAPNLEPLLDHLTGVELLLQVADQSGNALLDGAVDYDLALAQGDPAGPRTLPSPDDLYILYTGGTTGLPKGVLWRQHDIYLAAMGGRRIGTWEAVQIYEEISTRARRGYGLKALLLAPLMHGAAQWCSFIMFSDGATVVLPANDGHLDAPGILATVEAEQINSINLVGDAMLRPLLDELEQRSYDLSTVLSIGNGGAPLTAGLRARLAALLPNVVVTDSVGASETGAQMHASTARGGGAGRFWPGPGTVVVDEAMTEVLPPGHRGQGWLAQTGWIPLGYLGDPALSERTFPTLGGQRHAVPGDRAVHLITGEVELLGRDSATINSGGEKIFAEEVEAALSTHRAVADVVVAGRPSLRWGHEVVALVTFRPGPRPSDIELLDAAAEHIARYKLPKAIIEVASIERSPAGKADYRWAAATAASSS